MQFVSVQEQLANDRAINQNELKLAYTRINDLSLSVRIFDYPTAMI